MSYHITDLTVDGLKQQKRSYLDAAASLEVALSDVIM